jgi:site-specific DNA-methyltransferase (adenine-specific)
MGYPKSILKFNSPFKGGEAGLHPTQKPVALLEYLIKTYTQENETVLDFTAGSMSTAIACINTNRKGIMIEKDEHYFKVGSERLKRALSEKVINQKPLQSNFYDAIDISNTIKE